MNNIDSFKICYTLLGGLGLFFYGMKTMSESLQSMSGGMIERTINSLTSNRFMAVMVGIGTTLIVQSSSVTTVMVVGLVNAGMMQLTQAIGLILGANIGTTVTGWLISIKIGKYGLLFIGLGIFPALFAKSSKYKQSGLLLFGIGMIFLGLDTMSAAFRPLRSSPEIHHIVSYFSAQTYASYFASISIGCLMTVFIQSSSAMLGITIALGTTGVISFQTAAALVLGENIGTTITALLASVGGNIHARRAARAHAIFNVFGVFLVFCIFPQYLELVDWLVPRDANFINELGEKPYMALHIAASHSLFNITNVLLFFPFINQLADLATRLVPDVQEKKQHGHLNVLDSSIDIVPVTGIIQVKEELKKFHEVLQSMFELTYKFFQEEKSSRKMKNKISRYEKITDKIQHDLVVFTTRLMQHPMTRRQSEEVHLALKMAGEFESIADYLEKLAIFKNRLLERNINVPEALEDLREYFDKVQSFFYRASTNLNEMNEISFKELQEKSIKLKKFGEKIRDGHLERVVSSEETSLSSLFIFDMTMALSKIRGHSMDLAEIIYRFHSRR